MKIDPATWREWILDHDHSGEPALFLPGTGMVIYDRTLIREALKAGCKRLNVEDWELDREPFAK